jgi:1,3-beta-glucan synthase
MPEPFCLALQTDDSISLISYLKAMFPKDWSNFRERISTLVPEMKADEISEKDFNPGFPLYEHRLQLQFWASNRGQLLARTVGGMMRYEKALRILATIEHPKPNTMAEKEYNKWIDRLVSYKFEYVVTAQTYGKNRNSPDLKLRWLGESLDTLLQLNPRLKAAFIDNASTENGLTQFSVCIRGLNPNDEVFPMPSYIDDELQVYEIYRVRLPINRYSQRGIILGEGKPENQNHATIFAHGEALQAIDMNQDNQLCEAYKMRNLLTELQPSTSGKYKLFADDDNVIKIDNDMTASEVLSIIRYRQLYSIETALVGFREYIFSDAAGALGKFAAATEYAFGTISQRIMTWPARIRLHYGHPDVFNKLFTISRGGISKATRLLHLTEDVFCGCSMLLRGGKIRYKEYINCGKGRDMGFDSINGFNFKISGGGGEWAISRESWRMGVRLDWFRLMSFYHGAVGFYINSWLTYCAVYFNIYAVLLFAWTEATVIGPEGTRIYNVQQVLQLGTLALIPYAGQLMLEMGVTQAALTLFQQIMTGSLLFYMFQQMTVSHQLPFIAPLALALTHFPPHEGRRLFLC